MKWDEQKSINKQYLLNKYKLPTLEAKESAENMRISKSVVNIFVDISELMGKGVFGLGICYVGQEEVITKSKKYYDSVKKGNLQRALLEAVIYSLKEIPNILYSRLYLPPIIMVYTTLDIKFTDGNILGSVKKGELNKLNEIVEDLILSFPDINFRFAKLDRSIKSYNPFYTAAHNAARNVLKARR